MKINLKDYQTVDINAENQDGLNKEWNDLSEIYSLKDDLQNLKVDFNLFKVETDTLYNTYDLLHKNIIKQHKIKTIETNKYNINIINPCIDIFEKALQSLKFFKEEDNKKYFFIINIQFLDVSFTHLSTLDYEIKEQELKTEFYEISIKKGKKDITLFEDWRNEYLIKLCNIIIKTDIKKNLYFINLFISRMYIKKLKENSIIINTGEILDDRYGNEVLFIKDEIIYKIKRKKYHFEFYKNEKYIEFL
ncbi:hypothetical protein NAPIS_ORF01017 [Vairimorpha apis BRL 01]|uniref:Uncharacterized protein n=1 Tax=Vairimorpha apis BRL 01 TaxID=1037528 RepID=T0MK51_9MICR|nr:hypothetical protein NAPIS_ORF01017 [Vairimorpha apis BRL 01]